MGSQGDENREAGWRHKWKRAWRRRVANLWTNVYWVQYKATQFDARYRRWIVVGTVGCFATTSAILTPVLQTGLASQFATEEVIQRIQNLVLTTGSALIGAAAIVAALVLFAMQVNVERMPHGLFHRFSEDPKLLGAFASTFILAIVVAALSIVTEQSTVVGVLMAATWAILFILSLFLYAYRRALRLINPLEQLQILLDDTRKDLRRWARRADRVSPMLGGEEQAEVAPSGNDPGPDAARTDYFQINRRWTNRANRSVQHAMAFARRFAEQADYEVTDGALTVIVGINDAYIKAKDRTFYTNALFLEHPLAHDTFITGTLEHLRQNLDRAIGRRDERQIEQTMQALSALVRTYLRIDYGIRTAEKTHAQLAAGYLANAVQAVISHGMTDVLMEGQRLIGRAARDFVDAGSVTYSAGLAEKIAAIASTGCAKESYRPVTTVGMEQLADLTLALLLSRSRNAGHALGKVREQVSEVAKLSLYVPDIALASVHGSMLGPYFSSSDEQGLRVRLTKLVNTIAAAEPDNTDVQVIIRNLDQWAEDLYRVGRELLLQAIKARSHFTIHMLQWIQGITEVLLVASNAPACDQHSQKELRKHARWLMGALSWIAEDEETVEWVERFQVTETLFRAALDGRRHGRDEHMQDIARTLLTWTFKGGRYITGWGVLERGLCGCVALALVGHAAAVDALKNDIARHLESDRAPDAEVLAHGAHGIRLQATNVRGPNYASSAIERAMAEIDHGTLVPLLEEIAEMLSPRGPNRRV